MNYAYIGVGVMKSKNLVSPMKEIRFAQGILNDVIYSYDIDGVKYSKEVGTKRIQNRSVQK